MAEEIEKLSVSLALESGSFSKQISAINKEIKNTERDFKSAGKGISNFEKSFVGLDSKIQKTSKQLDLYNTKLNKQKEEYDKLSSTVEKQKSNLEQLESTVGKGSDEWKKQAELVQKNSEKLNRLSSDINQTENNINKLSNELEESVKAFEQLGNKTKTVDEKLSDVSRQANLAESEFNRLGTELEDTGSYFAKLGNDMNQLSSQIQQNVQKIDIYQSEIDKLSSTLDKNKKDHQQLSQQINQTESELNQAKSAYGENSTEVQQLNQKLLQLKDRYNSVETEIEQNNNALQVYQTELNNTQAEVNQLSNELRQMPFDRIGTDLVNAGQKTKQIGQNFTTNITLPLLGAGVAVGKMSYDFEQGLAKVGSLVGKSGQEMKDYEDRIKSLSKETGVGINELTEAMYQGISAGADLNNIFGLLETSLKLSIGGFTTSETAIDGLTTAMNAFGISYDDVNKVADKFILTQNKGKTTVDALASSIGKVAPIAVSAGVSLEELLSATASLTMNGIETSEAMTALKAGFSNIIKPSSEAAKLAKSLGLEFDSTSLKSLGLAGFLDKVKEATGGNLDTMAKLFGSTEALNAILVLTGEGADEFTGVLDSMSNSAGLAQSAFDGMKESAGAGLLDSLNSLKTSMISMGDAIAPTIEWLSEKIEQLAEWFSNLDEDAQKNIVTMAGLAMAIGPVLSGLGTLMMIGGNATIMLGGLTTGATTLTGALAILTGPVGIGLAITAFLGIASSAGKSEEALGWLQDKFGSLGTVVGAICEFIAGLWNLTFDKMIAKATLGMDVIAATIDGPGGATVKGAWDKYNKKMEDINKEAWDNITLTTTRNLSQQKNSVDKETKDASEKANKNTKDMANAMDQNTKDGANAVTENMQATSQVVMDETGKIPVDVQNNMDQSVQAMRQAGSDIYNGMTTSFERTSTEGKQHFTNLYNGVTTSTSKMADKAIEDWKRIRDEYSKTITGEIVITTTNKTVNETVSRSSGQSRSNIDTQRSLIDNVSRIDISQYDFTSGYYTPYTQASKSILSINKEINSYSSLEKMFDKLIDVLSNNKTINQNNNINITAQEPLSPSQVARKTRKELEYLGRMIL